MSFALRGCGQEPWREVTRTAPPSGMVSAAGLAAFATLANPRTRGYDEITISDASITS